jgi:hypothetical protein
MTFLSSSHILHYLPFAVVHHLIPLHAICSSTSHHLFSLFAIVIFLHLLVWLSNWHIIILVGIIPKVRFSYEELMYFLWTLEYLLKYYSWRQYPIVEEIFIDIQELQVLTTSLILGFRCISFIAFCELFKCNVIAFMLHLRGVLRI